MRIDLAALVLIAGAKLGDWSPSGRQIVYIAHPNGSIHLARSNGTGARSMGTR